MTVNRAPRGLGGSITTLDRPSATPTPGAPTGIVAALRGAKDVPAAAPGDFGATLRTLPIGDIAGHPDNPRDGLGDLTELAASIREFGILQPPIVIPAAAFVHAWPHHRDSVTGHAWVVVAGHRRHAAARLADLATMDVVVRSDLATPEAAAAAFVVENIHRAALAPLEEARAYALLADLGLGQRDIARRTGVSQSHVSKRLSLLRLPQAAQDALTAGSLLINEALVLATVDGADQDDVWLDAVQRGIPLSSAVDRLEKTREIQRRTAQAHAQAARDGLEVIDPTRRYGGDRWEHRLHDDQEIATARASGTLHAAVTTQGTLEYYSAQPHHPRTSADPDETHRRHAAQARAIACRRLVATAPSPQEALADLVRVSLAGSTEHLAAMRLAHAWLREVGLGTDTDDPLAWLDSVQTADPPTRTWVAWALTVARDETHAASIRREWDAEIRHHLQRLTERVGYEPSPWERHRVAAATPADGGDSDGITPAGPVIVIPAESPAAIAHPA